MQQLKFLKNKNGFLIIKFNNFDLKTLKLNK